MSSHIIQSTSDKLTFQPYFERYNGSGGGGGGGRSPQSKSAIWRLSRMKLGREKAKNFQNNKKNE